MKARKVPEQDEEIPQYTVYSIYIIASSSVLQAEISTSSVLFCIGEKTLSLLHCTVYRMQKYSQFQLNNEHFLQIFWRIFLRN